MRLQKEASEERKASQETVVKASVSKEGKPKTRFRCGSSEHMVSKCPEKKRCRSRVESQGTVDQQAPRQWRTSPQNSVNHSSKGKGKGSSRNMHSQPLLGKGGKGRYGSERPSKQ